MFINEIISGPHYVEGRKFTERTINSKFNKGNVSITTVYMNDNPLLKQYTFDLPDKILNFWKSFKKEKPVKEVIIDKNLDVIG